MAQAVSTIFSTTIHQVFNVDVRFSFAILACMPNKYHIMTHPATETAKAELESQHQ